MVMISDSISASPNGIIHFNNILNRLVNKQPTTFIRFSDGETEILRNRYLEIGSGITTFRGKEFKTSYPKLDSKRFDPNAHQNIRSDLLESAMFQGENYYKGIPTSHNNAIKDREFMLRLNGGFDSNMTFADLFLNSNYLLYRKLLVPEFNKFKNIYIIANYRANPVAHLKTAEHIKVPDNFFATYDECIKSIMHQLLAVENNSLVLCSASSLTNIIGYRLYKQRCDITFLDIGTSINDLLSLPNNTRVYHSDKKSGFSRFIFRNKSGYVLKW